MKVLASLTLAFLATLATGAELQRDHTDPAGKCKYRSWPYPLFAGRLLVNTVNINKCGKILRGKKKSVLAFLVPLIGLYRETNFLYFSVAIFQVVKFPNVPCEVSGGNKNGTCYTSEECSDRGGVSDGSCADGYGVCCVCKYFGLYFSQLDKISRTF